MNKYLKIGLIILGIFLLTQLIMIFGVGFISGFISYFVSKGINGVVGYQIGYIRYVCSDNVYYVNSINMDYFQFIF